MVWRCSGLLHRRVLWGARSVRGQVRCAPDLLVSLVVCFACAGVGGGRVFRRRCSWVIVGQRAGHCLLS